MKAPVLYTERLVLKPLSTKHLTQEYCSWLNDADVTAFLESRHGYTMETLEEYLKEVEKKDVPFWAIHIKSTGEHIGNYKLDPLNLKHGLGELGGMIGKKSEWGKGFAKEASLRIIKYGFEELALRKITGGISSQNEASLRLYLNLGFVVEGVYRHHVKYGDKYHDSVRIAIFNPAFTYNEHNSSPEFTLSKYLKPC